MNATKTQPINLVFALPGQLVRFELANETLIVSTAQIGSVVKMEYKIVKKVPALLDVQKN